MSTLGDVVTQDLTRTEDDTDDLTVRLKDSSGNLIDTTDLSAVLSIGTGSDATPVATFNAAPPAAPAQPNGLLVVDMDGFSVAQGKYSYDIRITDAGPADSPARVYFKGLFTVTPRIN